MIASASEAADGADACLASARASCLWYERHAKRARLSYQTLEVFQIGTGALIPLAAAVHWPIAVTATLGAAIALAGGIRSVFRWQANWIAWATTAARMRREILLYTTGASPYAQGARGELLVRNVADLEMSETLHWAKLALEGDANHRLQPAATRDGAQNR